MEIYVKFNEKYAEVVVSDGNARIETGLMDAGQQLDLAEKLMQAAADLVAHSRNSIK